MKLPTFEAQKAAGAYKGWNDAEARADFQATGGQDTGGGSSTSSSSTPSSIDPQQAINNALSQAKQVRQFNIDSSQPQISTLQSSKSTLDDQYAKLLASIKGDQTLAVNNATLNTNNELGKRGILGSSGAAQTAISSAQSQAAQPYSSLGAKTGIQQAQDENSIAAQIAALQSGNPAGAMASSQGISGIAGQLGQLGVQQQVQNLAAKFLTIPGYGVLDTTTGQLSGGLNGLTSNLNNGQIIGRY